ncbi:DUF6458 family protein [Nocardioides sp. Kera G14]|uniref:DUF6458 family protein n=1 Tax=Nocardioides sp. Kera G14 TaxID=2884264 RepID=UPI001D1129A7|nr:DUF6458 family protein [Nocardioides sp. Kera G14]UDY24946.1 DUF6458 family protein [Nocardioides sp. Kera G14]
MGYGFGGFLIAVGLILALAVQDNINGIELTTVGWILAAVGVVLLLLQALTLNRGRRGRTTETVTHRDGTQSVAERDHYDV